MEKRGWEGTTRKKDEKGGKKGRIRREDKKGGHEGRMERESLSPNYNYFIANFYIAPILIINSAKIDQNPSDTLFAPRTLKFLPTFLSRRPRDKYVMLFPPDGFP